MLQIVVDELVTATIRERYDSLRRSRSYEEHERREDRAYNRRPSNGLPELVRCTCNLD